MQGQEFNKSEEPQIRGEALKIAEKQILDFINHSMLQKSKRDIISCGGFQFKKIPNQ